MADGLLFGLVVALGTSACEVNQEDADRDEEEAADDTACDNSRI